MSIKSGWLRISRLWVTIVVILICVAVTFHFVKQRPRFFRNGRMPTASQIADMARSQFAWYESPHNGELQNAFKMVPPAVAKRRKKEGIHDTQREAIDATAIKTNGTERAAVTPDDQDLEFDREAKQLAIRLRSAKPDEQSDLRQKLESLNERHFEYRQQQRKEEIERLSGRVDALRLLQLRRQEHKAEILKRRMNDLTGPNADLDWDTTSAKDNTALDQVAADDRDHGTDAVPNGSVKDSDAPALAIDTQAVSATPAVEQTFDGIPYSEWLKMLETERKPEKLATAMEACSRLADAKDERKIARRIFLAARLFEAGNTPDRFKVWYAGSTALERLSADAVVAELIAALRDEDNYKGGREFQASFLFYQLSGQLEEVLKKRADEIISDLVKLILANHKDADGLLAGASCVWRYSNRPIDDFGTLKSLIIRIVDEQRPKTPSWRGSRPWMIVAENLVQLTPETPGLALMLMKHAKSDFTVVELIGKMKRHAEPAVSPLVDQFLEEWKKCEARDSQGNRQIHVNSMCVTIVRALAAIGVGDKGYGLLRELSLIGPVFVASNPDQWEAALFEAVTQGLRKFSPLPQSEKPFVLLDDKSLIIGQWKMESVAPYEKIRGNLILRGSSLNLLIRQKDGPLLSHGDISGFFILPRFEIDDTKTPKQITLRNDQTEQQQYGLYDLTETTLRIQLAKVGEPRPTELVTDKSKLPEGQLLLELERKFEDAPSTE